jgi:hypothetical protein
MSIKFACAVLATTIALQVSTATTLQLLLNAIGKPKRKLPLSVFGKWSSTK